MFSQHSYGRAIDINPQINPCTNGKVILPKNGAQFIDRHKPHHGKIMKNRPIYKLLFKKGGIRLVIGMMCTIISTLKNGHMTKREIHMDTI